MPLTDEFRMRAAAVFTPSMGTENMAPLLYALARFIRPKNVLEIGAGYTTLFLLQALADNDADHRHEIAAIAKGARTTGQRRARHSLLRVEHYRTPHRPKLFSIDDDSHPERPAARVRGMAKALGLGPYLRFEQTTSQSFAKRWKRRSSLRFDLMWLDAGGLLAYEHYLRDLFPLVTADGGMIVLHSTETNLEAQVFVRKLKLAQATTEFCKFELLGLLEPHKLAQNSCLLIRSTVRSRERIYSVSP
jgi:predicted O-methyltransferase YrrM